MKSLLTIVLSNVFVFTRTLQFHYDFLLVKSKSGVIIQTVKERKNKGRFYL